MNKYGFLIQDAGSGLDLIEQYQPVAVCLMDAKAENIRAVRERSSGTLIVFWRHEGKRHWSTTDPEVWAEEIWRQVEACPPHLTCYHNEPLGHDAIGQFADFDQRQARFIRKMRELSGGAVQVGAFCFAEGNFTRDGPVIPEHFPESTAEADWVFLNEYWKPHLDSPGMQGYHCMRWPYWLEWFEAAERPDIQIGIKECGITMAVGGGPDVGWMSEEAKAAGVTDQSYLDDLARYYALLCEEDRVKFALTYIWYPWPGQWQSFRHDDRPEIYGPIMAFEEPTGGENMLDGIRVFKWDDEAEQHFEVVGIEAENLVYGKYGAAFRRAEVETGQKAYRLKELWERRGNASLVTQVRDEQGQPMANVDVALYWPGAPEPPDPPTEVYAHDWYPKFVHGATNANGDVGPGMGPGAYHGRGEGGPHAVWVRDPEIPSDICEKLGMLAGTPHDHLDQKFALETQGAEPGQPGGERELKRIERLELEHEASMMGIAIPTAVAVEEDARGDGRGPGVDETIHPAEWIHPDGTRMALMEMCTDFEGDEGRAYTMTILNLRTGEAITETEEEVFEPLGTPRKRVIYVYAEGEGEPGPGPTPEPEPEPEGMAELHRLLADYHGEIARIHERIAERYDEAVKAWADDREGA